MRDCYDTCALLTEIKDGKMRVRGNPENAITSNFLCAKGSLLPRWFYSSERLEVPLLRKASKPTEEFEKISWKEAISIIAKKIKETKERYGEKSILLYYYYGDRGFLNSNFPHRLFNYLNASIVEDAICDRAGEEALKDIYGTSQGMDPEDLRNEDLIVFWGINALWTNLHGFIFARNMDLEMWCVDVVKTVTAKNVDKFYKIKPETDVLFALGVAKIMVEDGLYAKDFVKEYIYGFDKFSEYLEGMDLDYIAKETGVNEEDLEDFARDYWKKKGVIHIGYGFQRSINGGEAVRAISILPALVGKKRGFIYSNRILPRRYVRGEFLRKRKGYKITQLDVPDFIEDGKIKFIFVYGANPFATLPNQNKLRKEVLENDVFIALHDIFFTDTARFSDVILPSNTFFERFDIADSYYHRYLALNEKALVYMGKSNMEVAKLLAKELQLKERALYEDEEEIVKKVLREVNIPPEKLWEKKVMKIPISSYAPHTESGKIEIYSNRAVKRGLSPFPMYHPVNGRGLKLLTPSYFMTISSQYHNVYGYEDPYIYLSPKDAEKRGIKEGDQVKVFNEYGEIITRARIREEIQDGVALMYKAFWPSKLGWNVNFLTPDRKNEGYGGCTTLHTVWVEVERI
ncbi:dehydrogenase [Euryarchaeota archaeon ex4484_178]|nr:MAG: dehydrogenase [Euryarchaeota archaeon ex4484_178]